MATRFYLHAASTDLSGTLPSGEQGAGTPGFSFANATTIRRMNPIAGASMASDEGTSGASSSAQRALVGMWASPPLDAQNIAAGTWTFNIAARESNTQANFWPNLVNLYVWRPSTGAKIGTVLDQSNGASLGGAEPTSANSTQVVTFTFSGSAVNGISAGDVLVCEVWAVFTQGNTTSRTVTAYWDGATVTTVAGTVVSDHASFIEHPGTIAALASTATATASTVIAKEGSRYVTFRAIGPGADISSPASVILSPANTRTATATASASIESGGAATTAGSASVQGAGSGEATASVTVSQGVIDGSSAATASVSVGGDGAAAGTASVSVGGTGSSGVAGSVSVEAAGSAASTASATVIASGTLRTLTARAIGPGADVSSPYTFQLAATPRGDTTATGSVSVEGGASVAADASTSILGDATATATGSIVVEARGTERTVTLRAIGPGADLSAPYSLTYLVQASRLVALTASVSVGDAGSGAATASTAIQGIGTATAAGSVSVEGAGAATATGSTTIALFTAGSATATASVALAPAFGLYDLNVQSGQTVDLSAPFVVTGHAWPSALSGITPAVTVVHITIDGIAGEWTGIPDLATGAFAINIGS